MPTINFGVTAAGSPEAGMTLTTARAWVRQFARNAGSSAMYSNEMIDRALQSVGNRFCRVTRCLPRLDGLELTADAADVPISDLAGTFRPEHLIRAYLEGYSGALELVDFNDLADLQADEASSAQPTKLAFSSPREARVYPTPDVDYTLQVRWWQPFTIWTAGTAAPDDVTLNIPEEILTEILPYGPTSILQHNEPEMKYAAQSWQKYLEVETRMKGSGSLAARLVSREMQQ